MPRSTIDATNVVFVFDFSGSAYHSEDYAPVHVKTVRMNDSRTDAEGWVPAAFDGLRINTYGLADYLDRAFTDWTVAFDADGLTLYKMEQALPTLKKIDTGIARINNEYGTAGSLGRYVQRVAKVLGIRYVGFYPPKGQSTWASGERIRFVEPADAAYMIDDKLRQWVESKRTVSV